MVPCHCSYGRRPYEDVTFQYRTLRSVLTVNKTNTTSLCCKAESKYLPYWPEFHGVPFGVDP